MVNALLTQLDKLRLHPNVLVLATSNIPNAIDAAFVDRADIKQFVPLPPAEAVYWILRGCLVDLRDKGMIKPCIIPTWGQTSHVSGLLAGLRGVKKSKTSGERVEQGLADIAKKCYVSFFALYMPILHHMHSIREHSTDNEGEELI